MAAHQTILPGCLRNGLAEFFGTYITTCRPFSSQKYRLTSVQFPNRSNDGETGTYSNISQSEINAVNMMLDQRVQNF
jgi:hypothetical protein